MLFVVAEIDQLLLFTLCIYVISMSLPSMQGLMLTSDAIEWNGYFLCYRVAWFFCWCILRYLLSENLFPQCIQANGLSPVWTFMCIFNWCWRENLFSHWVQLKGFSPVWTLWCLFRVPASAKHMWHWVQLKGFTPVWTLWWISTFWGQLKPLLQNMQRNRCSLPSVVAPPPWALALWTFEFNTWSKRTRLCESEGPIDVDTRKQSLNPCKGEWGEASGFVSNLSM